MEISVGLNTTHPLLHNIIVSIEICVESRESVQSVWKITIPDDLFWDTYIPVLESLNLYCTICCNQKKKRLPYYVTKRFTQKPCAWLFCQKATDIISQQCAQFIIGCVTWFKRSFTFCLFECVSQFAVFVRVIVIFVPAAEKAFADSLNIFFVIFSISVAKRYK